MKPEVEYSLHNMRISGDNRHYHLNQIKIFVQHFDSTKIKRVVFGKQDIRGGFSITLFNHRGVIPRQLHFDNRSEMLGYISGFVASKLSAWNRLYDYENKRKKSD